MVMKLVLTILVILLALPIALTGGALAMEFTLGPRSVACFARCANGRVLVGAGMAWH